MASIDSGLSTANKANVDTNYNLQVNLPTTAGQAGYVQHVYAPTSTTANVARVTYDGVNYTTTSQLLFEEEFNSTSASYSPRWGTNATTMTAVAANGWMRLNSGAITTTTTGVSMYTQRVFRRNDGAELRVRFKLKHNNAFASNKQADFGLGYYGFAAGQAAAMNEFIGFRFTTGGGLEAVLESTTGGAPTNQNVTINGNAPYTDGYFREYEIIISDTKVEYWVESVIGSPLVLVATISRVTDNNFSVTKANALPLIMRVFNSGVASAAATFDIGSVVVTRFGGETALDYPTQKSMMGRSSFYHQPDIIATNAAPHNHPTSGTVPTTQAPNATTTSALANSSQMGGVFQITGSAISAAVGTHYMVAAYQNPVMPVAAGSTLNTRNFICTGISIQPLIVNVVLVGGGFTATWFLGVGSSAISLATTDANGTTAVAAKAPRIVPLSTTDTLAAAAAAGTVSTRQGDSTIAFATPVVVAPGEFLHIGFTTRFVTAAITSGNFVGGIYVNGYWE